MAEERNSADGSGGDDDEPMDGDDGMVPTPPGSGERWSCWCCRWLFATGEGGIEEVFGPLTEFKLADLGSITEGVCVSSFLRSTDTKRSNLDNSARGKNTTFNSKIVFFRRTYRIFSNSQTSKFIDTPRWPALAAITRAQRRTRRRGVATRSEREKSSFIFGFSS